MSDPALARIEVALSWVPPGDERGHSGDAREALAQLAAIVEAAQELRRVNREHARDDPPGEDPVNARARSEARRALYAALAAAGYGKGNE